MIKILGRRSVSLLRNCNKRQISSTSQFTQGAEGLSEQRNDIHLHQVNEESNF